MTNVSEKLSAYLDGALPEDEAKAVEEQIETDPHVQSELEALMAANDLAKQYFDELLKEPVPEALIQSINEADDETNIVAFEPKRRSFSAPLWQSLAASFVIFVLGGLAGYYVNSQTQTPPMIVAQGGWLTEIAGYHAVYAKQKRHLVEVPATEIEHIEKWLGKTTEVKFAVPDLASHDLRFEGARLLVIKGEPVAQLIYKETDGAVIALCLKKKSISKKPVTGQASGFATTKINQFDFVSWNTNEASYTVVGPDGYAHLKEIAELAANRV